MLYGLLLALAALRSSTPERIKVEREVTCRSTTACSICLVLHGAIRQRKELVMRRSVQTKSRPFGAQVAFARAATGLGWMSLGALAVGATATGAVAIGALAVRALAVKRGRIGRLEIEELEVGRLRVKELIVERREEGERA
jgi:hypothetical protein